MRFNMNIYIASLCEPNANPLNKPMNTLTSTVIAPPNPDILSRNLNQVEK